MSITPEVVRGLPDDELARFIGVGVEEQRARAERKKKETIERIKELAGSVGVRIAIGGARGRPAKVKADSSTRSGK
jgi:hypothetical protein